MISLKSLHEMTPLQVHQLYKLRVDVFVAEPLAAGHPLRDMPNTTLAPHAAFRTPEASDNLIGAALDHCRRIVAEGK